MSFDETKEDVATDITECCRGILNDSHLDLPNLTRLTKIELDKLKLALDDGWECIYNTRAGKEMQ